MPYEIQYLRHGTLMQKFIVPSAGAANPCAQPIRAMIDKRLHKAIARAEWSRDPLMSDVLRKELVSLSGAPMGCLVAIARP